MRVVVVGLGYVGSVCSACLAERGHDGVGVDRSAYKVERIGGGESPIVEKGLPELIARAVRAGRLTATTRIADAMPGADIVLVCVGTPSAADGSLDLSHVKRACAEVGTDLKGAARFVTVVMRSTMLPGSVLGERAPGIERAAGGRAGREFGVAYNPEFLREGTAVEDFFGADYTILGAGCERAAAALRELYAGVGGELIVTPIPTAEMLKYVNNSFHALKVTFANEFGRLCKREGVDSHEVMRLMRRDTKLNLSGAYLSPGFAFGGSCLPQDLRAVNPRARPHRLPLARVRVRRLVPAQGPARRQLARAAPRPRPAGAREHPALERAARDRRGAPDRTVQEAPARVPRPVVQGRHRRPSREPDPACHRCARRQGARRPAARPEPGHGPRARGEPPLRRGRAAVPARAPAPRPRRGAGARRGGDHRESLGRVPHAGPAHPRRAGGGGPGRGARPRHGHGRGVPWPRLVGSSISPRT